MGTYRAWDESGHREDIEAVDAEEAAREYVDGGSWDDEETRTVWHHVSVVELTDGEEDGRPEDIRVERHPMLPSCPAGEHDFTAPHEVVGGVEDNPGVWSEGGGVRMHTVCLHCGCGRVERTWDTDRSNGEQGLHSFEYRPGEYANLEE